MIQRPGPLNVAFGRVVDDELAVLDRLTQSRSAHDLLLRLQPDQQHLELVERDRLAERARDVDAHRDAELRRGREHAAVEPARDQHFRAPVESRELAQQLDAVAAGHLQVEQEHGRREVEDGLRELSGIEQDLGLEAEVLADLAEERAHVRVVVHHEQAVFVHFDVPLDGRARQRRERRGRALAVPVAYEARYVMARHRAADEEALAAVAAHDREHVERSPIFDTFGANL